MIPFCKSIKEKVILRFLVAGIFALARANVIQIVYIVITLEKQKNDTDFLFSQSQNWFLFGFQYPL